MFEKGDKYIHFTKYGGINKGEVEYFGYVTVIDSVNGVQYKKYYIVTTKKISLELDGSDGKIYKVEREYTPEECERIATKFKNLSRAKNERLKEMEERFKDKFEEIKNNIKNDN